jgi:uncharacterized membrane protein
MKTRIIHFFEVLSSNFWVIPLLLLISGAGLAFLNVYLDKTLYARHIELPELYLYFNSASNIRTLLSVSATSILGVAGVSFSITIASLTLASQQFGPRLLRNFMSDRFNQLVLGCFIGTFLYCILMLQFTGSMELDKTTPFFSMMSLLTILIFNLLLLVFFIHHIAVAIQAETVITEVNNELVTQMNCTFPNKADKNSQSIQFDIPDDLTKKFEQKGEDIYSTTSGYLQAIDTDNLVKCATDNDYVIKFIIKPGDFILTNSVIAYCLASDQIEEIEKDINTHLLIGSEGTPEQDPEFAVRQLVEVAVRALSPGINDPFTAISCIKKLGENIAFLMQRQFPTQYHLDDSGQLRLELKPFTFRGIVDTSFDQIRQHGKNDIAVVICLLQMLNKLILQSQTKEHMEALKVQAEAISSVNTDDVIALKDKEDIKELYDVINVSLNTKESTLLT